jgi:hypothetical protein
MKTILALVLTIATATADLVQFEDQAVVPDINASGTVTLPRFDTSLGSLTAIYLYVHAAEVTLWDYQNPTPNLLTARGVVNYNIHVDFPGAVDALDLVGSQATTEYVQPGDDTIGTVPQAPAEFTVTKKTVFPLFQGVGDIVFSYTSSGSSSHTEAAGLTYESTSYSTEILCRVIYYFDHVVTPPPAKKNSGGPAKPH